MLHNRTAVLVYAAIAVLAITLSYIFVFIPYQQEVERQEFIDAEAKLEQVYEEKIATVMQPDSVERDRFCRYSSRKSAEGDLTCTVLISAEVDINEPLGANKILETITDQFNSNLRTETGGVFSESDYVSGENDSLYAYQDIGDSGDILCSVDYSFGRTSDSSFHTTLSCTKPAMTEHFSLTD